MIRQYRMGIIESTLWFTRDRRTGSFVYRDSGIGASPRDRERASSSIWAPFKSEDLLESLLGTVTRALLLLPWCVCIVYVVV